MDLHAEQIQGFFEVPVDHLYASTVFFPYLQQKNIPKLLIAAPDTGGTKRANAYAKLLGSDLAICYKQRKVANQVESITVIGDVKDKKGRIQLDKANVEKGKIKSYTITFYGKLVTLKDLFGEA